MSEKRKTSGGTPGAQFSDRPAASTNCFNDSDAQAIRRVVSKHGLVWQDHVPVDQWSELLGHDPLTELGRSVEYAIDDARAKAPELGRKAPSKINRDIDNIPVLAKKLLIALRQHAAHEVFADALGSLSQRDTLMAALRDLSRSRPGNRELADSLDMVELSNRIRAHSKSQGYKTSDDFEGLGSSKLHIAKGMQQELAALSPIADCKNSPDPIRNRLASNAVVFFCLGTGTIDRLMDQQNRPWAATVDIANLMISIANRSIGAHRLDDVEDMRPILKAAVAFIRSEIITRELETFE